MQIFGPASSQQEVYDHTIREMVRDVLRGENRLLYTYGVTNSGKTYTVQGESSGPARCDAGVSVQLGELVWCVIEQVRAERQGCCRERWSLCS